MTYIEAIGDYNRAVQTFPGSMFGHTKKEYYQGNEGIENPPVVDFSMNKNLLILTIFLLLVASASIAQVQALRLTYVYDRANILDAQTESNNQQLL